MLRRLPGAAYKANRATGRAMPVLAGASERGALQCVSIAAFRVLV